VAVASRVSNLSVASVKRVVSLVGVVQQPTLTNVGVVFNYKQKSNLRGGLANIN
jgi:hypothetical protein